MSDENERDTESDPYKDLDAAPQTCVFCGSTVANVEAAIEADWESCFYVPLVETQMGDDRVDLFTEKGPACEECSVQHLDYHKDIEEFQIKPGHTLPA